MKKLSIILILSAMAMLLIGSGCSPSPREPVEGRNWVSPATGMEFVWIEDMDMWVGKYEVTNEECKKMVPRHDSGAFSGHALNQDRQPVVRVNFSNGKAYAEWMTERDRDVLPQGYRYRLPSNEEWTTFAQCGDGRKYPWGNEWPPVSGQAGNYADEAFWGALGVLRWQKISGYDDGFVVTAPVDELWVNPWGLAGVGGNVWEMCASDSDSELFGGWRGSSWNCYGEVGLLCSYIPFSYKVGGHYFGHGFRLVLSR